MNKVDIIIMGKTGVGKSTLVNAVFKKDLAKTGVGNSITIQNEKYRETIPVGNQTIDLTLYDTVGLEIDSKKNHSTIQGIQSHILHNNDTQNEENINIIWYCINSNSNRFEQYEDDLLNKLRYQYEIPYVIVLTQTWSRKSAEELSSKLKSWNSDLTIIPILAEDYETDIGIKTAFGIKELLFESIYQYNNLKIKVLGDKVKILERNENYYIQKRNKAFGIVEKYAEKAFKIGCVPVASIISSQIIYGKMLGEIANVYGISLSSEDETNIAAVWIANIVFSPIFAIPGLSGAVSKSIIEDEGKKFINVTEQAVRCTNGVEDNQEILERIKSELKKRKG